MQKNILPGVSEDKSNFVQTTPRILHLKNPSKGWNPAYFFQSASLWELRSVLIFDPKNETNWSVLVDNHPRKHPEESHERNFQAWHGCCNAYPVCHCVNAFKQPKLTSLVLPPKVIVVAFRAAPKGHLKSKGDWEKNGKMQEIRRPTSTVRPPSWHNGRIIRYLMILYHYI